MKTATKRTVPQKPNSIKALEGTVKRIWARKLEQDSVSNALKGILAELSSELVHLESMEEEFIGSLRNDSDWFGSYLKRGKKICPQMYADRDDGGNKYFAASLIYSLLKKIDHRDMTSPAFDPSQKARERFALAEAMCERTNRRLRHYRHHPVRPLTKRLDVEAIFHGARQKISKWLGSWPNLEEVVDLARHGPGGNLSTGRPFVTPYYKFGNDGCNYKVTHGAHALARAAIVTNDSWRRALCCEAMGITVGEAHDVCFPQYLNWDLVDAKLDLVDYNKVTFVPKNAETMRSIAIEPDMNIYLQLGVGAVIRRALKAVGCNLDSQERNQALAWLGSIEGAWYDPITADMSMASDTLAVELVRELLPPEWFNLLYRLRSPMGRLDGKVYVWEKFSSMGNGYTFELESLIFYALAQSVQDRMGVTEFFRENGHHAYDYLSVYGDDIIVPAVCWPVLRSILEYCGFAVNWDKSFTDGPFRESCGCDYWAGNDVRPLFLSKKVSKEGDLIKIRNGLNHLVMRHPDQFVDGEGFIEWVDSLLDKTLYTHLRGVGTGMHASYINVPSDQIHVSGLVNFSCDYQAFLHPIIHEKAQVYRGKGTYRFLQFLYTSTSRERGSEQGLEHPAREYDGCALLRHISSGGSRGDVVRSGMTVPTIAYRTV